MNQSNPFDVLGLTYPSSKEEIKARYYELARKHHPDKLQHLSPKEIDLHEQEFKRINLAYELLSKNEYEYEHTTKNEWNSVWEDLLKDPDVVKNVNEMFQNVIDGVKKYASGQLNTGHQITLDVSLEEVYNKKDRRLRLFLKDRAVPIFISINCSYYPFYYNEEYDIHITINLTPHPIYSLDTLFDTTDMFCTMYISIYEYLNGCYKSLSYLDSTILEITVPPCSEEAIVFDNKGLYGEGTLTVFIKVILPQKEDLNLINEEKNHKLMKYLKKISNAHQYGMKSI